MTTIATVALAVGVWVWFAASTFVPVSAADRPIEYVFVGAPVWLLVVATILAGAFLYLHDLRYKQIAWARPLGLLGLAPLALIALVPGVAPRLSLLLYVLVDLRWWWTAAIVATAVIFRLKAEATKPPDALWLPPLGGRTKPSGVLCLPPLGGRTLFVLLTIFAIITTPQLRFDSALHGDEPKYLRFCENWYQGRGLEVSGIQTMEALGAEFSPPLWRNVTLFGQAVREEFTRRDSQPPEYAAAWVIRGKNGGYYQVHNPGLSAILFPAYFVDRHFIATSARHQGVFPAQLPVTNLAVLLIWAAWGVVLFRLLRVCLPPKGGSHRSAAATALFAMMTMPVAAFGFQIYPEAAAGAIVCGVLTWTFAKGGDEKTRWAALAAGAAAGFLPWLHLRFAALSLVLLVTVVVRAKRHRVAAVVAYGIFLAALCLYAYHLTGSLRPDAMYGVEGSESAWIPREAAQSVISIPFDRIWGFFPHAPIYLFALPGFVVLARRSRAEALTLATLILALLVPVAGHGFTAAGATPLRQMAAVIPLLAIPLVAAWREWGDRTSVRMAFAVLLVLSLDTAVSYNLHHYKEIGRHIDAGFSGWAPNLLFPWTHGDLWTGHTGTFVLFLLWVAVAGALLWTRRAVFALGALLLVATALGGEWTRQDYFLPAGDAHDRIVAAARKYGCQPCLSSSDGFLSRADIRRRSRP